MLKIGESKFETAKVALSFRRSKTVIIDDESKIGKMFVKEKIEYSIDKKAVKQALESGQSVEGARIQENQNLQIK